MLKKLTATGVVAAAAAGFMLLGGAANADRLSVGRTTHRSSSYYPGNHYGRYGWHHRHHGNGWGGWHHRDRRHHRFHFHY